MAVLSGATASGRSMYAGIPSTTANTVVYTAPAASTNVTSPSATAYIKEIALSNTSSSASTVNVMVNGVYLFYGLSINGNDAKILSGLNTMMPASSTIQVWQGTANNVHVTISGTEVQ